MNTHNILDRIKNSLYDKKNIKTKVIINQILTFSEYTKSLLI
jgi:hypothetical protein